MLSLIHALRVLVNNVEKLSPSRKPAFSMIEGIWYYLPELIVLPSLLAVGVTLSSIQTSIYLDGLNRKSSNPYPW
jgi:hypothetical protein